MSEEVKGTKALRMSSSGINLAAAFMAAAIPPSPRLPASEMSPLADPRYQVEDFKQKDRRLTSFQKKRNKAKKAARKARRRNRGY